MAIIINITLNYVFIFGHLGVPAMGAQGAALATPIARAAECAATIGVVYKTRSPIACRIKEMFGYSRAFLRQFYQTTSPVIANEFIWGLGATIYSLAYGRMGIRRSRQSQLPRPSRILLWFCSRDLVRRQP